MDLGDLEFTQQDLQGLYVENECCGGKLMPQGAGMLSVDINRILQAKLEKAQIVGSRNSFTNANPFGPDWNAIQEGYHTHTARLVCIEEIKK